MPIRVSKIIPYGTTRIKKKFALLEKYKLGDVYIRSDDDIVVSLFMCFYYVLQEYRDCTLGGKWCTIRYALTREELNPFVMIKTESIKINEAM